MTATNHADLMPDTRRGMVDGKSTTLLNADAVIHLISKSDTPAARNLYLTYRAAEAVLARVEPWLGDETRRARAVRHALEEDGVQSAHIV